MKFVRRNLNLGNPWEKLYHVIFWGTQAEIPTVQEEKDALFLAYS